MSRRRTSLATAGRTRAAGIGLSALLLLLFVVLGVDRVLGPVLTGSGRPGWFQLDPKEMDIPTEEPPTQATPSLPVPPDTSDSNTGSIIMIILIVLAAIALITLAVLIMRRVRELDPPDRTEAQDVPDEDTLLAVDQAQDALSNALETLDYAATPRDAVVDAWLALELAIDEAGIERKENQTTSEYVTTVLGELDLPQAKIDRFADLYRRALFDQHPLSEQERTRAREALTTLLDSLEVSAT
jgi:hypothetical protein